jgi:hypothetical protein
MHGPPAVSYPFGRTRVFAFLLIGTHLTGAWACAAWYLQMDAPDWRLALALLLWSTGVVWAWQTWRSAARGVLFWDGREWQLQVAGHSSPGLPTVRLDWQGNMLMSWQPASGGPVQWIGVERASEPRRWDDLRRAVYSRAPSTATAH